MLERSSEYVAGAIVDVEVIGRRAEHASDDGPHGRPQPGELMVVPGFGAGAARCPGPEPGAFAKAELIAKSRQHRPHCGHAQAHAVQDETGETGGFWEFIVIRAYGR